MLTLCMPTYNRDVNVCEALEHIIPKIRPYNFRSIVVDNCSPDNTRKVVEAYQGLYDRFRIFQTI
ncbi:MAG: glycosyltransferase [Coprobacter fastidiosus]